MKAPDYNFEEDIIYMLRHVDLSEEGRQKLWDWYTDELDRNDPEWEAFMKALDTEVLAQ